MTKFHKVDIDIHLNRTLVLNILMEIESYHKVHLVKTIKGWIHENY